MGKHTKSDLTKSNGRSMNRFNIHDIFRMVLIVLLSLLAFFARGIHTQQADISGRLLIVEKNQVKIMTVLGIEPYSLCTQNRQFLAGLSK